MRSLYPWPTFPPDLDPPTARSLSLLFVLQEFLSFCQLLERFEDAALGDVERILPHLDQLGSDLDTLCFYCEILLQASKIGDEAIILDLEEMRNAIMKIRSKAIFWKKKMPVREKISSEFTELYNKLHEKLTSFFLLLVPFLQESRTDENVLLYLVEHCKEFNLYLGPKTIENLFNNFFPSGPHELRAMICAGYTRRGFGEFYVQQEPLLDALEWEIHGCPSQLPMR